MLIILAGDCQVPAVGLVAGSRSHLGFPTTQTSCPSPAHFRSFFQLVIFSLSLPEPDLKSVLAGL
jgi:hypothetical protein